MLICLIAKRTGEFIAALDHGFTSHALHRGDYTDV